MAGLESAGVGLATKYLGNLEFPTFQKLFNTKIDKAFQQKVYLAFNKYFDTYNKRHGILKVLGMREAVSLDDIYTTVQLFSERESLIFASITDLEKNFRNSKRKRFY